MGLLDSLSGGGLLPFDQLWQATANALTNGTFDPWGQNNVMSNGMPLTANGGILPPQPSQADRATGYGMLRANMPQPQPPPQPPPLPSIMQPQPQSLPASALAFGDTPPQQPPPPMAAPAANVGAQPPAQPLFPGVGATGLSGFFRTLAGQLNPQLYQRNLAEQSAQSTHDALVAGGMPEVQARAAALNPNLFQTISQGQSLANPAARYAALKAAGAPEDIAKAAATDAALFQQASAKYLGKPQIVPFGGTLVSGGGQPIFENQSAIDPQTIDVGARRIIQGDTSPLTQTAGYGSMGVQIKQQYIKRATQILTDEFHLTPQQAASQLSSKMQEFHAQGLGMGAQERQLGTMESKMGTAGFEALGAINLARDAITKVPRTSFLPFNKLIQGYQTQTLNPDQAELYTRIQGIRNTYAAVMARGANVTTDAARARADELLNTAANPDVLNRVMNTMESEINMALNSPEKMRQFYRSKYGKGATGELGSAVGAQPTTATAPASPGVIRYDAQGNRIQ